MFKNPILLLTYKRPKTTKIIIKRILEIKPKKLYIFQDGPKRNFKALDNFQHKETFNLINKIKNNSKYTKILFFLLKKILVKDILRTKF